MYDSPLNAVRNEFGQCPVHHIPGTKCDYDNLRYQNWDLRFGANGSKANPYDEILMKTKVQSKFKQKFNHKEAVKYLLGFPLPPTTTHTMDTFFETEFSNQKESFLGETTRESFQTYRKDVIQQTYQKMMKVVKFPKSFFKTFMDLFINIPDYDYTHIFTDFYLLCRMFQTFGASGTKIKRSPKRCPLKAPQGHPTYEPPQYIIVYAGSDHIVYLQKFLSVMFQRQSTPDICRYYTDNIISSKKISLDDLTFRKGFPKPDTLEGLFTPFYDP